MKPKPRTSAGLIQKATLGREEVRPKYDWAKLNEQTTLDRGEAAFYVRLSQPAFDRRVPDIFPVVKLGRRSVFLRTSLLAALARLERKPFSK